MRKNNYLILLVILLIGTLTQISTDVYTPSLPAIAGNLNTSLGQAQLTMTWLMIGIGITTFIYGPLSEVIGRRWTILIGNVIALVGVLFCVTAHSIEQLQMGRLIQGMGLGAAATLWRSVFRDTYSGPDMAKVGSYLTNIVIISVIVAPFLGGYLEQYFGWRSTFIFLCLWTALITAVILFLFTETNQHHGRHRLKLKFIFGAYKELLSSRVFMSFSVYTFLIYGGLFTWMTSGPAVLIHGAGITPVMFGYLMILIGTAKGLGGFANGKLVYVFGIEKLMILGWALMILSGFLMLIGHYFFGLTIYDVLVPAMIFIFGTSFIFANATAGAFTHFGHIAGYAGSLYSSIQLLGGAVFSAYISHLNTSSQVPMAWLFIASGALAWLAFLCIRERT